MNVSFTGLGWVSLAVILAGAAHAVHALMHVRTARGTIAWIIALLCIPWIAVPAYWFLGRSRFHGFVDLHRSRIRGVTSTLAEADRAPAAFRVQPEAPLADLQRVSTRLGGFPFTRGHRVELLINGDTAFRSMLQALYRARHYILVTFFIIKNDGIGRAFQEALIDRARHGIRVLFMYDSIGSRKLPRSYLAALREAGVQVCAFDTTKGRGNRFQLNFRNHRKIVVVDGIECFAGGLNLGDEYLGQDPHLGPWRDTHLHFSGPAVADMQQVFLQDWYWAAEELPELLWPGNEAEDPGVRLQVMPTGPADDLPSCQLFFLQLIATARERLWITSPYFVPDGAVQAALQRASLRGVDVRLLLPGRPDHLLVYLSSFTYYEAMLDAGVKLYRYHAGFMHQKVILVDDLLTGIGTANLDNRSFHLNFEVTINVADRAFTAAAADMLRDDFSRAKRVQIGDYRNRSLPFRAACRLARLMAPVQ